MILTKALILKKAEAKDIDLLFEWINDAEVRAQSLSSKKIFYADHIKWFSKKLSDSNCYLYIAYANDLPYGMIRFDINANTATISYLVDRNQRGKGVGSAIVAQGLKKFLSEASFHGTIHAHVKASNSASIKIFERLRFDKEKKNEDLIDFKKPFL